MPSIRSTARPRILAASAAVVGGALIVGVTAAPSLAEDRQGSDHDGRTAVKHVLLLSVDGLHQKDLDWYVRTHPASAIAALAQHGTDYTRASTPVPSDSFPGMVAQVTGGNPGTTGVYYDDTYNHALLPAGTTNCVGAKPGAEVAFTEAADKNQSSIDAGQGLSGLPGSILAMTGTPATLLDPAQLPVDPATCKPVYPHQYLKVNTVFEVAKQAGLHTAWSDKHPAYEILNGPSGSGVDDLFTPEINSDAAAPFTGDWTSDNLATQQYDGYKVKAVLNEIDGKDHSGTTTEPVPAIFGMNFQTVSTAQKLPTSDGLTGGYLADGSTPGPLLSKALDYVNASVGAFVRAGEDGSHARHDHHPVGQARPVPDEPGSAQARPGRPDHRRARRRVDRRAPRSGRPRRVLDRRRHHAAVADRPLAGRRRLRQAVPGDAHRSRQRHREGAGHRPCLRPGGDLRRLRGREVLRHLRHRPADP